MKEKKDVKFNFVLEASLLNRVSIQAELEDKSVGAFIRECLKNKLKEIEEETKWKTLSHVVIQDVWIT